MMKLKYNQKGTTSIEILIGLVLASIVLVAAVSMISSVFTSSSKSKYSQELEQVKNDLAVSFSTNIKWANEIKITDPNGVLKLTSGSNTINYVLSGTKIQKDGGALTPVNVNINSFEILKRENALEIKVEMEHALHSTVKDSLDLIIVPRVEGALE